MLVGLGAAHEMVTLLVRAGYRPLNGMIYGGSLLVIASNAIPLLLLPSPDDQPTERLGWPLLAFALVLLAGLVGEMSRYRRPGGVIVNGALATFSVAYIGVLLSFVIAVACARRSGYRDGQLDCLGRRGEDGRYGCLHGRAPGRPAQDGAVLSPGKTIEGATGALAGARAGSLAVVYLLARLTWLANRAPTSLGLVGVWPRGGRGRFVGRSGRVADQA